MKKKNRLPVIKILMIVCIFVFVISAIEIYKIYHTYAEEERKHQELLKHKPVESEVVVGDNHEVKVINQSVIDLKEQYPAVIGWLTIDNTNIDYPFVQGKDNKKYLRHDIDSSWLGSGSIFMDYRHASDFSDFVTILYGHTMKNDSMFGSLDWFRDKVFFLENSTGTIFLPYRTMKLEILADVIVRADEAEIYDKQYLNEEDKQEFISFVTSKAENIRDGIEMRTDDTYILLSTCVYDFEKSRMVLITRVVED